MFLQWFLMTKTFLKYKLNESAIQRYVLASWGDGRFFPIKRALDAIIQELTNQDKNVVLSVNGDFTDPKYFPQEFMIERNFENEEVYSASLKGLVDIVNKTQFLVKSIIIPYSLENNFIED